VTDQTEGAGPHRPGRGSWRAQAVSAERPARRPIGDLSWPFTRYPG